MQEKQHRTYQRSIDAIAQALDEGVTDNNKIGELVGLSPLTVRTYRSQEELGVRSHRKTKERRREVARLARKGYADTKISEITGYAPGTVAELRRKSKIFMQQGRPRKRQFTPFEDPELMRPGVYYAVKNLEDVVSHMSFHAGITRAYFSNLEQEQPFVERILDIACRDRHKEKDPMIAKGYSTSLIALILDRSRQTVHQYMKDKNLVGFWKGCK